MVLHLSVGHSAPQADPPPGKQTTPPWADTPPEQTPPGRPPALIGHTPTPTPVIAAEAGGTQLTGMHSCLRKSHVLACSFESDGTYVVLGHATAGGFTIRISAEPRNLSTLNQYVMGHSYLPFIRRELLCEFSISTCNGKKLGTQLLFSPQKS